MSDIDIDEEELFPEFTERDAADIGAATLNVADTMLGELVATNARYMSITVPELATRLLYTPTSMAIEHKGETDTVLWVPGHTMERKVYGPQKAPVMLISRTPLREDTNFKQHFRSGAAHYLLRYLEDMGMDYTSWYVTCLVKFQLPDHISTLKASWIKESKWFLANELAIVQPEVVVMLGTDVVKALFSSSKNTVTLGRVRGADSLTLNGIPAVPCAHPGSVLIEPMRAAGFRKDLGLLLKRIRQEKKQENTCQYVYLNKLDELRAVVDMIISIDSKVIAVDCEWGSMGEGSDYLTSKLRCMQFSIAAGTAFVVQMRKEGLEWVFDAAPDMVSHEIGRLLCRQGVRLVGHAMRADLKFLMNEMGLDLEAQVNAGYDTMLMYHMFGPHEEYGLNHLILLYTDRPRYDMELEAWLKKNGYGSKKVLSRFGYSTIPDSILLPYAAADVDVLMQIYPILEEKLRNMPFYRYGSYQLFGGEMNTLFDLYRFLVQPAAIGLNAIEMEGFPADEDRLISLVHMFLGQYEKMLARFRESIRWPEFNPRSVFHVKYFLYGKELSGKDNINPPHDADILNLMPIKTTDKPSRDWDKLSDRERRRASPSTDSETLDILAAENPKAADLKNIRFIDQMIKNFLRPANVDEDTGELEFDSGLISVIDDDGRVRTNISQITDTGRYRSANPNMQNLPNKQEVVLKQLFCPDDRMAEAEAIVATGKQLWSLSSEELKRQGFLHPAYHELRSCFVADYGYVLVEADYQQAELNVLAYLANDPKMIEILSDPTRDLHSETAVTAFKLPCHPSEVKDRFPKQRIMAKNVNFGIAYGRGAAALVRQIKTEGIILAKEDAQRIIDVFFELFPMVKVYMDDMKACVVEPGYVETPFGRRRRFYPTRNRATLASNERQAINMPIQGTVADCLTLAIINFYQYRKTLDDPNLFRVTLPVHDALFFQVAPHFIKHMTDVVIPMCMTELCPVPRIGLKLKTDISKPMARWKVKCDVGQLLELKTKEWNNKKDNIIV
jgi:uracil-DNA glycosylase family 4